jgi:hypothetical protein
VAAVGAEELDLLVPKLVPVAIEFTFALRAGYPKNFRHDSVPRKFSRKGAKALSLGIKRIPKFDLTFASLRPFDVAQDMLCERHTSLSTPSARAQVLRAG